MKTGARRLDEGLEVHDIFTRSKKPIKKPTTNNGCSHSNNSCRLSNVAVKCCLGDNDATTHAQNQ